ncbi:hypothetical protein Dip518_001405 [Parelusimicrobium proximum]|uniref:hypothetical protein n=1 Tax=Parelusimicrobium proximum TaxID=3228953 RepID=UPI003D1667FB
MKKVIVMIAVVVVFAAACATVKTTSSAPAQVSFNFYNSDNTVLTFWKKMNADGTVTGPFAVGVSQRALLMNSAFPKAGVTTIDLDPGYYFMDSFQVNFGSTFFVSEKKRYTSRNGWDASANKPKYLGFRVKEGEKVVLPKVEVIPGAEGGDVIAAFKYDDPDNIFILGTKVNKAN